MRIAVCVAVCAAVCVAAYVAVWCVALGVAVRVAQDLRRHGLFIIVTSLFRVRDVTVHIYPLK